MNELSVDERLKEREYWLNAHKYELSVSERFGAYTKDERVVIKKLKSRMEKKREQQHHIHKQVSFNEAMDVYDLSFVCNDLRADIGEENKVIHVKF